MMRIGTMAKGSICSVCQKDISKQFGVQIWSLDYCKECFEKDRNKNIKIATGEISG